MKDYFYSRSFITLLSKFIVVEDSNYVHNQNTIKGVIIWSGILSFLAIIALKTISLLAVAVVNLWCCLPFVNNCYSATLTIISVFSQELLIIYSSSTQILINMLNRSF